MTRQRADVLHWPYNMLQSETLRLRQKWGFSGSSGVLHWLHNVLKIKIVRVTLGEEG